MGKKGKTGKNRQDKFYHLAKEQGFRSRASFKLVQLNKRHDFLSSAARGIIDLCAAPGGWMQVARKHMPLDAPCIGIDLVPIRPVPGCIGLVGDITAESTRSDLKRALKQHQGASSDEKVDVVLNDGSPNMGKAWLQDAYTQSELTLAALRLASEFLAPGGTFVTKVFRSNDYNSLLFVMNQLFRRVNATKPSASRSESAEIYVMCIDYRAPRSVDPRLLNPKYVFKDMSSGEPADKKAADENKPDLFLNTVMRDMKKQKRNRGGYEDGALTLFNRVSILDFCRTSRPVALMVDSSQFSFDLHVNATAEISEEAAKKALEALREMSKSTDEVMSCCEDLKVLARSEFKLLLKWRVAARAVLEEHKLLNPSTADEPVSEEKPDAEDVEMGSADEESSSGDSEEQLDEELKKARGEIAAKEKRKKRKANKLRSALQRKIDMKVFLPQEAGAAEDNVQDGLFSIKTAMRATKHGIPMSEVPVDDTHEADDEREEEMPAEEVHLPYTVGVINDAAAENTTMVEEDLDRWYKTYLTHKKRDKFGIRLEETKERRRITKRKALREALAKKQNNENEEDVEPESKLVIDSSESSEEENEADDIVLNKSAAKSREAALWFSQPLFQNVAGLSSDEDVDADLEGVNQSLKDGNDDDVQDSDEELTGDENFRSAAKLEARKMAEKRAEKESEENDGFEIVPMKNESDDEEESDEESSASSFHSSDYDTDEKAEMVAIGRRMRKSKTEASDVLDEAYNRYTFNDPMDLPRWFADTDPVYRERQPPVTKEQVAEVKEYIKSLAAAPTKKEAEAKARRKARMAKKVEAMKAKANSIAEQGDVPVNSRMKAIEDLYKQAMKSGKNRKKNRPKQYQVVRPNGRITVGKNTSRGRGVVKGARTTLVDKRLKADKRGMKKARERNARAGKGKK